MENGGHIRVTYTGGEDTNLDLIRPRSGDGNVFEDELACNGVEAIRFHLRR